MKKNVIISATILILVMAVTVEAASSYAFYKKMIRKKGIGTVREYYSEDLTYDILANRGDDIIVEKIIGTVTNKKKDGRIMGGGSRLQLYLL